MVKYLLIIFILSACGHDCPSAEKVRLDKQIEAVRVNIAWMEWLGGKHDSVIAVNDELAKSFKPGQTETERLKIVLTAWKKLARLWAKDDTPRKLWGISRESEATDHTVTPGN